MQAYVPAWMSGIFRNPFSTSSQIGSGSSTSTSTSQSSTSSSSPASSLPSSSSGSSTTSASFGESTSLPVLFPPVPTGQLADRFPDAEKVQAYYRAAIKKFLDRNDWIFKVKPLPEDHRRLLKLLTSYNEQIQLWQERRTPSEQIGYLVKLLSTVLEVQDSVSKVAQRDFPLILEIQRERLQGILDKKTANEYLTRLVREQKDLLSLGQTLGGCKQELNNMLLYLVEDYARRKKFPADSPALANLARLRDSCLKLRQMDLELPLWFSEYKS